MSYTQKKIAELKHEINSHAGYGESKRFYEIKQELIDKLGKQQWERLLSKAKLMDAVDSCEKMNARIKKK